MTDLTSEIPVTSTGIPVRNFWYILTYAWNELAFRDHWRADVENAPSLDALLATILCKLIEQRMRIGLDRGYRSHEATISGVRGRVLFGESLKRLAFEHGKAHCKFEVFSSNVLRNQVIRSTLARLAQVGEFGSVASAAEVLRHRVRVLVHSLHTIDLIELKPDTIRREQLERHDADYRVMLAICYLFSRRHMPTEVSGNESLSTLDRDAMTLWRVYESFVANFYRAHLADWAVHAQPTLSWHAETTSDLIPSLKPDVVLRHKLSQVMAVIDTKFTGNSITPGQWDNLTFNRDHLFQMYAYLRSQEEASHAHRSATGILLYPTVKHELSEVASIQGHAFRWETVNLALPWKEIEQRLMSIPAMLIDQASAHA